MSVNGLKFVQGQYVSTPLEMKSGSYIYHGDAGHFRDWEFRTRLRIALFESASAGPVVAAENEEEETEDIYVSRLVRTQHFETSLDSELL